MLRNISRFRLLREHLLRVEFCKWHGGSSIICDKCECGEVQDDKHVLFLCKCAEVCELRMRYKDLFEGMFKTHQCIPESRLIQTPQVCVRLGFSFRHWLILFHQPIAISQSLGL